LSGGNEQRGEQAGADDDAVEDEDGSHAKTVPPRGGG
jgi:hypothetical protein